MSRLRQQFLLLCFVSKMTYAQLPDGAFPSAKNRATLADKPNLWLGIKAEGNELHPRMHAVVANQYEIYSTAEFYQGYRLGAFLRKDWKRFQAGVEFAYFSNQLFVQFRNLNPKSNANANPGQYDWYYTGPIYLLKRAELTASGAYRIKRWLRVGAGLTGARQISEKYRDPINRFDEIIARFPESYRPFLLSGRAGIGADWGRFTADFYVERSLTPMSTHLPFNGVNYPLRQHYRLLGLSVGYKLFRLN